MRRFLVIETKHFIDPHGSADDGGVTKFLSSDENMLKLDGKYVQHGTLKNDEDRLDASEDGYNSEAESYEVKEINEEQYVKYKHIIEQYDMIGYEGQPIEEDDDDEDNSEITYEDIVESEDDEDWESDEDSTFDDEELDEEDSEDEGESVYEDDESDECLEDDFEDEDLD